MTSYKNLRVDFDLNSIRKNDKITICKQSDFGFPIAIKLTVDNVTLRDYAQYKDCLFITGKLQGKRKVLGYLLKPNSEFVIASGFQDLSESYIERSTNDNFVVSSWGRCFDTASFEKSVSNLRNVIYSNL